MPHGYLNIQLTSDDNAHPIDNAMVRVFQEEDNEISNESYHTTNAMGMSGPISLHTLSSCQDGDTSLPYTRYHVEIHHNEHCFMEVVDVPLFSGEHTLLPLSLTRIHNRLHPRVIIHIPTHYHALNKHEVRPIFLLPHVPHKYIPSKIRVHLQAPSQPGEDVDVDFITYIKCVVCSEVFPTYSDDVISAYIHSVVSFVLCRVYTHHYQSLGYDFTITNEPHHDLSFSICAPLFTRVTQLVDSLFNVGIYNQNTCITALNFNLPQAQSLANKGRDTLAILRYFYGANIQLVNINKGALHVPSYPGTPPKRGRSSSDIARVVHALRYIEEYYPLLGDLSLESDTYTDTLQRSVEAYQHYFQCTPSGRIDKATWYSIFYLQARLVEGAHSVPPTMQPHYDIDNIKSIKEALNIVGFRLPTLPTLVVNAHFDSECEHALTQFQTLLSLPLDNTLSQASLHALYTCKDDVAQGRPLRFGRPAYPSHSLYVGSSDAAMKVLESALMRIQQHYPTPSSQNIFHWFQTLLGLPVTNEINHTCFSLIHEMDIQLQTPLETIA